MKIKTKAPPSECGFFQGAFFGSLNTVVDKARDAAWKGDLIQASNLIKEARFRARRKSRVVPGLSAALRSADSALASELHGLARKPRDPASGREARDKKIEPVSKKILGYMGRLSQKCDW